MSNFTQFKQETVVAVADGEWMMIHADTFIPERERILLKESAFMIDRDLSSIVKESMLKKSFECL